MVCSKRMDQGIAFLRPLRACFEFDWIKVGCDLESYVISLMFKVLSLIWFVPLLLSIDVAVYWEFAFCNSHISMVVCTTTSHNSCTNNPRHWSKPLQPAARKWRVVICDYGWHQCQSWGSARERKESYTTKEMKNKQESKWNGNCEYNEDADVGSAKRNFYLWWFLGLLW
jgi:hypothetical protein